VWDGTFHLADYAYQIKLKDSGKGVDHPILRSIKTLLQISHIPCTVAGSSLRLSTTLTVCIGIIAAALLPGISRSSASWWLGTAAMI
jgi:hypothetical protein